METMPAAPQAPAPSPSVRAAAGKKLRESVPREAHAQWKGDGPGRDPIGILQAADATRRPELVPLRYGRMLQSPFAFYRGSASIMAADLSTTPSTGVRVQCCGDCHLMNFGGFATPERNIIFDINDFDETLPGPWEWDVKRLVASFVLAARSNGFSGKTAREIAETAARTYREYTRRFAKMHPFDVYHARLAFDDIIETADKSIRDIITRRVRKAQEQRGSDVAYPKLTESVHGRPRIRDNPPFIYHPEAAKEETFEAQMVELLGQYRETLAEDRRTLFDRYSFVDAALKVVGIGSVGTNCWIALMMSENGDPLFLQFKEANDSVLAKFAGASAYPHNGQRVVMGQRLMQAASDIFLGWLTGPAGKQFYGRQLRDAKISARVETFDESTLEWYAQLCGWTLARAHARTGDAVTIGAYLGRGDDFDEALGEFAVSYADQAEKDYDALKAAIRDGRVDAQVET